MWDEQILIEKLLWIFLFCLYNLENNKIVSVVENVFHGKAAAAAAAAIARKKCQKSF